jgi:thiol-disulfide isomerase/thioredoxin
MTRSKFVIWFSLIMLTAGLLFGCRKKPQSIPAEPNNIAQQPTTQQPAALQQTNPDVITTPNPAVSQPTQANTAPKPTLREIAAQRKSWNPAFMNWYSKMSPDFTVTDINGVSHKLSDYRGKNVMLIFWATWCGPCLQEIPSLIELRKTVGRDKLAILGISYIGFRNSAETIKRFVAANPIINYTIITADVDSMPFPYNSINAIPATFFINPDGTIKFATEGVTPLSHIKAILDAEE